MPGQGAQGLAVERPNSPKLFTPNLNTHLWHQYLKSARDVGNDGIPQLHAWRQAAAQQAVFEES